MSFQIDYYASRAKSEINRDIIIIIVSCIYIRFSIDDVIYV